LRGSPSHSVARLVDCILEDVPDLRKYQLQNERANRLIADLLDAAEVPADRRGYFQQLLTTVLKLHEDHAGTGDLKITTTALKELRYAFKVFAPYSTTRKVTVFGSARATSSEEATRRAKRRPRVPGSSASG